MYVFMWSRVIYRNQGSKHIDTEEDERIRVHLEDGFFYNNQGLNALIIIEKYFENSQKCILPRKCL